MKKYNIEFDTLVCDCEGALYYILQDFPELMDNIKLIIIENDFPDLEKKWYCDNIFKKHGLELVHSEAGGYIEAVCFNFFYQVWKKPILELKTNYINWIQSKTFSRQTQILSRRDF